MILQYIRKPNFIYAHTISAARTALSYETIKRLKALRSDLLWLLP